MNFLDFEFDSFKIKACLPLDKFKRVIKKVKNIFKKKNSNINKEL